LLQKVPVSFAMSVHPLHALIWLPLDGFLRSLMLGTCMIVSQENKNLVEIRQNYWALYMKSEVQLQY